MINAEVISGLLQDEVTRMGLFVVEVTVRPVNRITIYVDSMKGVTLDECMAVSRFLESRLDRNVEDFELEVSSPGLDKPLKLPVLFEKNTGRFLDVVKKDGIKITGKLLGIGEGIIRIESAVVVRDSKGKKKTEVRLYELTQEEIKTAKVVISQKSK